MRDVCVPSIALSEERILVVAPHPDDDVLACGGTIARGAVERAEIRILYVTDGAASHLGSLTYPPQRLRAVRENEAKAAAALLGIAPAQLHFLREPDSELARTGPAARKLAARIAAQLVAFVPTIVLSPWVRDGHRDHVAVSLAVRRALALVGFTPPATLYEYTVWLEDYGTAEDAPAAGEAESFAVDVRAYRRRKTTALHEHRSQLGGLIVDAAQAFALPQTLLARADVDWERFYRIPTSPAIPA